MNGMGNSNCIFKKIVSILIVIYVFFVPVLNAADDVSRYCDDEEVTSYWEDLKLRNLDDLDIVSLVEYRDKLCDEVTRGEISRKDAKNLFNDRYFELKESRKENIVE